MKLSLFISGVGVVALAVFSLACTSMPGDSATAVQENSSPRRAEEMREDVRILSQKFPARNLEHPQVLERAIQYLEQRLSQLGSPPSRREKISTPDGDAWNLITEVRGTAQPERWLIVGGHYDTAHDTPGANDNATGTAATMALARIFAKRPAPVSIRFILFANEEPPRFKSDYMGSRVHAKGCKERGEEIIAMLSLETLGYYNEAEGTQQYPGPVGLFYPSAGNFVAFVGNVKNRALVRRSIRAFREAVRFPSEGAALPDALPGISWSDHWSFWQEDYPALMITDTAPFRDPHYHQPTDSVENLDFDKLSTVVEGIEGVIRSLALSEK